MTKRSVDPDHRPYFATATYDEETGELADLKFAPAFKRAPAMLRADVLKDLLHAITVAYGEAVGEIMRAFAGRDAASVVSERDEVADVDRMVRAVIAQLAEAWQREVVLGAVVSTHFHENADARARLEEWIAMVRHGVANGPHGGLDVH